MPKDIFQAASAYQEGPVEAADLPSQLVAVSLMADATTDELYMERVIFKVLDCKPENRKIVVSSGESEATTTIVVRECQISGMGTRNTITYADSGITIRLDLRAILANLERAMRFTLKLHVGDVFSEPRLRLLLALPANEVAYGTDLIPAVLGNPSPPPEPAEPGTLALVLASTALQLHSGQETYRAS